MSIVQVVNQLVLLLVIPLVMPTIGLAAFAQVAFVQSLATVMSGLVDYGYTHAATRRVSVNRSDMTQLSTIVSEVISTRLVVFLIAMLLMAGIFLFLPDQTGGIWFFLGALSWVLGNALWPHWFFLGIERMHWITLINTIAKLMFFLAVTTLLRQPGQGYMLILFFGLSNIGAALAALALLKLSWNIGLRWPGLRTIRSQLHQGWPLFISTASTTSLVNSNVLVLGLFVQGAPLGVFGVAEKILLAIQQLLSTFSQATYPALCQAVAINNELVQRLRRFFLKNYLWFYLAFAGLLLTAFFASGWIMQLMGGNQAAGETAMLRMLLPVALLISLNIFPSQLLLAFHRDKSYQSAFLTSALANLAMNFLLAPFFGPAGTAAAMWATHLLLNLMLWLPAISLVRKA